MNVSFQGIGELVATFEAGTGVVAGTLVKTTTAGKADACAAGDKFCGVAVNVRDGFAAVLLHGYAEIPCSGTVALGYQKLAAASGTAAKADETNGREILVLDVQSGDAPVCGILL